eukprot:TRINITY_DN13866_c0_g1_i1.p1 TRINITY_DN13866_c0_g1~~TRINITY_DN13866_c0_g1_i1.p1  ORF type:complete len:466 (+),score=71.32 TRINITY_DN13866_c0_g1_i1:329-1726(+)
MTLLLVSWCFYAIATIQEGEMCEDTTGKVLGVCEAGTACTGGDGRAAKSCKPTSTPAPVLVPTPKDGTCMDNGRPGGPDQCPTGLDCVMGLCVNNTQQTIIYKEGEACILSKGSCEAGTSCLKGICKRPAPTDVPYDGFIPENARCEDDKGVVLGQCVQGLNCTATARGGICLQDPTVGTPEPSIFDCNGTVCGVNEICLERSTGLEPICVALGNNTTAAPPPEEPVSYLNGSVVLEGEPEDYLLKKIEFLTILRRSMLSSSSVWRTVPVMVVVTSIAGYSIAAEWNQIALEAESGYDWIREDRYSPAKPANTNTAGIDIAYRYDARFPDFLAGKLHDMNGTYSPPYNDTMELVVKRENFSPPDPTVTVTIPLPATLPPVGLGESGTAVPITLLIIIGVVLICFVSAGTILKMKRNRSNPNETETAPENGSASTREDDQQLLEIPADEDCEGYLKFQDAVKVDSI